MIKEGPAKVVLSQQNSDLMGEWGWSYQQRAVVSSLRVSQIPEFMKWNEETNTYHAHAFQVFLPTGPLALLPVCFHSLPSSFRIRIRKRKRKTKAIRMDG